jgi:hypothetical protein
MAPPITGRREPIPAMSIGTLTGCNVTRPCTADSLPPEGKSQEKVSVLPIDTFGGAQWTERRTFTLAFSLAT